MARTNSQFKSSRSSGPTYACHRCHKLTRETGHGEQELELCAYCLLISYAENGFNDGVYTQDQYDAEVARVQKLYGRDD